MGMQNFGKDIKKIALSIQASPSFESTNLYDICYGNWCSVSRHHFGGYMSQKSQGEGQKVSLTVRCTREEAEAIREEARRTHRSISGLMIHATMKHITDERHYAYRHLPFGIRNPDKPH